jgi:DNA-3-methyladenine glycosylase II
VAAHLFWAYYHVVKRREGAPVQTPVKPASPEVEAKRTAKKIIAKKLIAEKLNGAARRR